MTDDKNKGPSNPSPVGGAPLPISDPQLWRRLQAWRHGNGGQRLKLLMESPLYIFHRNQPLVIDETLRFAYLAARQDGDSTPPPLLGGVLAALRDEQSAFNSLEIALGRSLVLPDRRLPYSDTRHEGMHDLYRSEFGHPPPGQVWYGHSERAAIELNKRWFWASFILFFPLPLLGAQLLPESYGVPVFFGSLGLGFYIASKGPELPIRVGENPPG